MKNEDKTRDELLMELNNLHRYLEKLPFKIFAKDEASTYVICNKKYADDLKISPEEIIGKNDYDFYPKDLADKYRTDDERIMKSGKNEVFEERYVLDGREHIVNTFKMPLKDNDGNVNGLIASFHDITQYKRAMEATDRQNEVLKSINHIFKETIACDTEEVLAKISLAAAEKLTGSKFGFIGEINLSGRFDTIALSNPGWDTCTLPESEAAMLITDMEIRGIWGKVIKDNAPLIVNDPPSHPNSVGIPEGHPPLTSFLGVPLRHGGRVIGMMALGNKEGGYGEDDIASIEALTVSIVEALRNKRAENKLAKMAQEILDVSTPVIQVWKGVVIAPLIGMLDSQRTQGFMDRFLEGIVATGSSVALLDITGVPAIDTQTGQHVIEAITAAKLLGTQVILTGVSPKIAQTLVHLGIDLSGFHTCASLSAGFKLALDMQDMAIVSKTS